MIEPVSKSILLLLIIWLLAACGDQSIYNDGTEFYQSNDDTLYEISEPAPEYEPHAQNIETVYADYIYVSCVENQDAIRHGEQAHVLLREGDEFLGLTLQELQTSVIEYIDGEFYQHTRVRAFFSGEISVEGRVDASDFTSLVNIAALDLGTVIPWLANEWRLKSWGCTRSPLYISNPEIIYDFIADCDFNDDYDLYSDYSIDLIMAINSLEIDFCTENTFELNALTAELTRVEFAPFF